MSLSCCQSISFPNLNHSPTTLKALDCCVFKPYGILNSLAVELGVKIISIDVEVVDEPFNYNLFLGWRWFYAITTIASLFFFTLQFPHQGKIVTIDQLDYCTLDIHNHGANNVTFFKASKLSYESLGVEILKYSSLMGNFPLSSPNSPLQASATNTILTLS